LLLDLMLEFFADDGHWTRGRYDDGKRRPLPGRRSSASEPQALPAEGTGDCAPAGCDAQARPSARAHEVRRYYATFRYQAQSLKKDAL
jgi:hypothetical protein